ncbi:MAG: tetratricopeptide repeat protein [Kiritimatiellae bacterium]|nr:tetratricopeptide repeat protein [Kiritimatiellia bacterium]
MNFVLAIILGVAAISELDLAREALRDGLYDIARRHAFRVETDEAREIAMEAYAREGKWESVLQMSRAGYYRAAALYHLGHLGAARKELKDAEDDLSLLLLAEIALKEEKADEALAFLKRIKEPTVDSKLVHADTLAKQGERKEAEKIWRELLPNPYAALNLGEKEPLRTAYREATDVGLKRRLGLRLGRELVREESSRDEGAAMIVTIVHDAPDTEGAEAACLTLGEEYLAAGNAAQAAKVFAEMLEVWPECAKNPKVQEGRGWANMKLGRHEAAQEAFAKAETLFTSPNDKALALVKVGDSQSQLGKGEEAMETYRRVLSDYADTPAAERIKKVVALREKEDRGRELYRSYKFSAAQAIFREIGEEDPSRKAQMDFYNVLCLYGQGRDAEAEAAALKLGTADSKLWLAKFYYNSGKWEEARQLFAELGFPEAMLWSARAALAENEFAQAVSTITGMLAKNPDVRLKAEGMLVQGQALIELARFDEAVLVLERVSLMGDIPAEDRQKALIMRADSLFAMGADNPVRYDQALEAYRTIRMGEDLTPSIKLNLAYKIGRTLEKQKKTEEALDQYYTQVVLGYRRLREQQVALDDAAQAVFARAAFRLADEYESRGLGRQSRQILELVVRSDVPAAAEAAQRIERSRRKDEFL